MDETFIEVNLHVNQTKEIPTEDNIVSDGLFVIIEHIGFPSLDMSMARELWKQKVERDPRSSAERSCSS